MAWIKPKKKLPARHPALLFLPVAACGLGYWQLQRLQWKQGLIDTVEAGLNAEPVQLPTNLADLENMLYQRVVLQG